MKKIAFIFLIIVSAAIIGTSVLPVIFPDGKVPDLTLAFLISGVAVFGFNKVWPWVIIAGIVVDFFSFRRLGTNVISFMSFSYATSFFSKRLILGEKIGGIFVGSVFIVLLTIIQTFWIEFFSAGLEVGKLFYGSKMIWGTIIWKVIFNWLAFFIFIMIFKNLNKKYMPDNVLLKQ